jgi:DNA (cytosine-5)-methyltransferase 1
LIYKHNTLNYISLFSGCGGLDMGFEDSGFTSLGAIDNNSTVLEVYKNNLNGPVYQHDLSSHTLPDNVINSEVDVLLTGSPCQGFSTAGKRQLDDPRNHLLLVSGVLAGKLSPKVVIAENVMGSLAGEHVLYWNSLETKLRGFGYNISYIKCCASDLGLAQIRKRVFLIAWKGEKKIEFKLKTKEKTTLREALTSISGLPNQDLFYEVTDAKVKDLIKTIKPGQKLCNVRGGTSAVHTWDIPGVFGVVTDEEREILNLIMYLRRRIRLRKNGDADPLSSQEIAKYTTLPVKRLLKTLFDKGFIRILNNRYDLSHTYNGLYKRMEWTKCSMTVDTRFGNPRYFLHPEEHRGFTVREAARIQGFPDSFVFSGSINDQYKMIGNAVPPPMAKQIAELIKEKLL